MKKNLTKLIYGIIEIIVFYTIIIGIGHYTINTEYVIVLWPLLLLLLYSIGSLSRGLLSIKNRYLLFSISIVPLVFCVFVLINAQATVYFVLKGIVVAVVGEVAFFRGVGAWDKERKCAFPLFLFYICNIINLIAMFFYSKLIGMDNYFLPIRISSVCTVLLSLFFLSDGQLKYDAVRGNMQLISKIVRRNNRLLLLLGALIIFLVSIWKEIIDFILFSIKQIFVAAFEFFIAIINLRFKTPELQKQNAQEPQMMLPNAEKAETNHILEIMVQILTYIIVIGFVLMLLWLFYKTIKKVILMIKDFLLRFFAARGGIVESNYGYVDERSSLFEWNNISNKYLSHLINNFSMKKKEKWEDYERLEDKIRFLYRSFVRKYINKGYSYKLSNTVCETGKDIENYLDSEQSTKALEKAFFSDNNDELLQLYNEIRYGKDKESKNYESKINKIKKRIYNTR